jgi:hypothetical protein
MSTDKPFGFLILVFENGRWSDTWDANYYIDRPTANENLVEALARGYTAIIVELVPVLRAVPEEQTVALAVKSGMKPVTDLSTVELSQAEKDRLRKKIDEFDAMRRPPLR